jgi:glycosyltransferase involved in cell wall biosynthesis
MKPRVCIVSHAAWGAMTGGATGHAGGVEYQTAATARWLAGHGFRVTLLVWNEGQEPDVTIDGVRVLSICRRDAGIPGLRFVHPRWTGLTRALAAADADVYYQNCGEYVTGQVALWCRARGRKFVFSVASDPDCDSRLPAMRSARERVLYRFGLRHADQVIVQTRQQQQMLKAGFGIDAVMLPMPCVAPAAGPAARRDAPPRFVWVGRVSPEKQPEQLIDIATALPQYRFDLAGPASDAWSRDVLDRAGRAGIRVVGRVSRDDMRAVYDGAAALLCTSKFEGFPNTFLEAWSHGVPVISAVDPDGLIASRQLGLVARSTDEFVSAIGRVATAADAGLARRCRDYYLANHEPQTALARFGEVFSRVCGATPLSLAPERDVRCASGEPH